MKRALILLLSISFLAIFWFSVAQAAAVNLSLAIKGNPLAPINEDNIKDVQESGIDWDVSIDIINKEENTIFILTVF